MLRPSHISNNTVKPCLRPVNVAKHPVIVNHISQAILFEDDDAKTEDHLEDLNIKWITFHCFVQNTFLYKMYVHSNVKTFGLHRFSVTDTPFDCTLRIFFVCCSLLVSDLFSINLGIEAQCQIVVFALSSPEIKLSACEKSRHCFVT